MILVNNPGSWTYVYAPLRHAAWNGLTPTDLVFPFFMFIMGISTYISLCKFRFEPGKSAFVKILRRTVVIFLIGSGINWLSLALRTHSVFDFEYLRIFGVMQRLALTYGITALIALTVKHKYIPAIIGITLLAYFFLLLFGNGFEFSENNIVAVVDRALLGANHLYVDSGVRLDPEGLLSTIPSVCHVLIGFYCGQILVNAKTHPEKMLKLFFIGAVMSFAGFLLSYGCPLNKKIWSPTFVLVTCGLCSTLLAVLIGIVDVRKHTEWSVFFESFGINPLFIYVFAAALSLAFDYSGFSGYLYNRVLQPSLGNYLGSLVYALFFVTLCWLIGNRLYKQRIYIKI
ncbi:membrane protein [Bacteroidia bacterium]|nr:membrane protein [Bacteroidia bacterium]